MTTSATRPIRPKMRLVFSWAQHGRVAPFAGSGRMDSWQTVVRHPRQRVRDLARVKAVFTHDTHSGKIWWHVILGMPCQARPA